MKISKFFIGLMLASASCLFYPACSSSNDEPDNPVDSGIKVELVLPATVEIEQGGTASVGMKAGSDAKTTDKVLLQGADNKSIECIVSSVANSTLSFTVPRSVAEGTYNVYVARGNKKTGNLGALTIMYKSNAWKPDEGTTVFGTVTADGQPVAGAVISDGVDFAQTDADGRYQMKSKKALGYVFISVPSGYEPLKSGILPLMYSQLQYPGNTTPENIDFKLKKVDQTNYRLLVFGDMHLADRTEDIKQFREFAADVKANGIKGTTYALTLGDMTWDLYWYSNKFQFPQYLNQMNTLFDNLMVYHTMGNHDNDMNATNNPGAKNPFIVSLAPNFYSFNIGGVHYVVLDDIDCSEYDGTSSRNYTARIFVPQLRWLEKDLSYVDKNTPVVLAMHAPVFYPSGATGFRKDLSNGDELLPLLKDFKTVHIVTGHTHKTYNATSKASVLSAYPNIMEHNVAAVCGDWWWSGHLTPGALTAHDGSPAGYAMWDINGQDIKWLYKGTGLDENVQFRAYDLNNVSFSLDKDVPKLTNAAMKTEFSKYCAQYPERADNKVLINLWNYDPEWTVTVTTETGEKLAATAVQRYDPLHVKAMTAKRYNSANCTSTPSFVTQNFCHFFEVTAPNPEVDLTITVTDRFGRTFTEKMERPKAFDIDSYKW